MLVAATLAPTLGVNLSIDPAKSSWERAINIMERHKSHVTSAQRGIEVIQRFRNYIALRVATREQQSPAWAAHRPSQLPQPSASQSIFNAATSTLAAQLHAQADISAYSQQHGYDNVQQSIPLEPVDHPMQNFKEILGDNALDQAWMTMQDFGQDDWMLYY